MPAPYETLRRAYEEDKRVTVTETGGATYRKCMVGDFTRVQTRDFEVWRFELHFLEGEKTLFGPDLESVEVLD